MKSAIPSSYKPYIAGTAVYPELPETLKYQLNNIPPSDSAAKGAIPCMVILKDGSKIENVYIVHANEYIKHWGCWPKHDERIREIDILEVVTIGESQNRLPKNIADVLYVAGESGMGYQLFKLVFNDGYQQPYLTGNAFDFIPLPVNKSMEDIVRVIPHEGREEKNKLKGLPYYWCLFGTGKDNHVSYRYDKKIKKTTFLQKVITFLNKFRI